MNKEVDSKRRITSAWPLLLDIIISLLTLASLPARAFRLLCSMHCICAASKPIDQCKRKKSEKIFFKSHAKRTQKHCNHQHCKITQPWNRKSKWYICVFGRARQQRMKWNYWPLSTTHGLQAKQLNFPLEKQKPNFFTLISRQCLRFFVIYAYQTYSMYFIPLPKCHAYWSQHFQ